MLLSSSVEVRVRGGGRVSAVKRKEGYIMLERCAEKRKEGGKEGKEKRRERRERKERKRGRKRMSVNPWREEELVGELSHVRIRNRTHSFIAEISFECETDKNKAEKSLIATPFNCTHSLTHTAYSFLLI